MFYKSASLIQTAIFQVKSCHKVAPSWGATLWQRCFLAEYDWEKKGWHKVTPSKVYLRYLQLVSALAMLQLDDKIIHTCTYSRSFTSNMPCLPTGLGDSIVYKISAFEYKIAPSRSGHLQLFLVVLSLHSADDVLLRFDYCHSFREKLSFKVYHNKFVHLEGAFCGTCTADPRDVACIWNHGNGRSVSFQ